MEGETVDSISSCLEACHPLATLKVVNMDHAVLPTSGKMLATGLNIKLYSLISSITRSVQLVNNVHGVPNIPT